MTISPSEIVYLTSDELAVRLNVTDATLRNWRLSGKGPSWIKLGRTKRAPVRYHVDAVLKWERDSVAPLVRV